jgi:ribosomal subunit interface protein
MNLKIQHRNFEIPQTVQRTIERKAQKVQKMLPTFLDDTLDLHVTVEKLPRGSQFQTTLVLTIPQTAIRVEEIADNTNGSVQTAFDELLRKLKKFKSQLNREKFWQRQPQYAPRASVEASQELESLINENLDKISNYVRRELFHRTVAENLPSGIIQPEALVDEVFLLMTSQEKTKPAAVSYEQWMYRVARQRIEERLAELDRESPHVEDAAGESREMEVAWEDEALSFFQPDESLRLEDVLKDPGTPNPEALMEFEETEDKVHKAIARLPRKIRESFVLAVLEGFAPFEVSMITGRDADKIQKDVAEARKRLREGLRLEATRRR